MTRADMEQRLRKIPRYAAQLEAQAGDKPMSQSKQRTPSSGEKRMELILQGLEIVSAIEDYWIEQPTIYLADGSTYTVDFSLTTNSERSIYIEVKGKMEWGASKVKMKFASAHVKPEVLFIYIKETALGVRFEYWMGGKKIGRPQWSPI